MSFKLYVNIIEVSWVYKSSIRVEKNSLYVRELATSLVLYVNRMTSAKGCLARGLIHRIMAHVIRSPVSGPCFSDILGYSFCKHVTFIAPPTYFIVIED